MIKGFSQIKSFFQTFKNINNRLILWCFWCCLKVSIPANEFYSVTKNVGLKPRSNAGTSTDLGHCGANLNMCIIPGLGRGRGCTVEFVDEYVICIVFIIQHVAHMPLSSLVTLYTLEWYCFFLCICC